VPNGRNSSHRQVSTRTTGGVRRSLGVPSQLPKLMAYLRRIESGMGNPKKQTFASEARMTKMGRKSPLSSHGWISSPNGGKPQSILVIRGLTTHFAFSSDRNRPKAVGCLEAYCHPYFNYVLLRWRESVGFACGLKALASVQRDGPVVLLDHVEGKLLQTV